MINGFKKIGGKLRVWLLVSALIVVMASCFNDEDSNAVKPVPVAYVSFYHASPDAPGLNVLVDNRQISSGTLDYTDYSGYLNFYTGERNFKFNTFNADNSLIDTTYNFEEGKSYSLFVIDRLSSLETLIVKASVSGSAEGKALVRFVPLSPDAPALDIAIKGQSSPLFSGKSFKQATPFIEIDAKAYSFVVSGNDAALETNEIRLLPGRFYTILVRGFAQPPVGNQNGLSVEVL
jgi:hypothetical protein